MDDSEELVTKEYQLDCREESKKWQFVEFLNYQASDVEIKKIVVQSNLPLHK